MRRPSLRLRGTFHRLRTEGDGAVRETAAVSLGVFIGCLPLYGLHLADLLDGRISRSGLNRLKMYLAANISNPLRRAVAASLPRCRWARGCGAGRFIRCRAKPSSSTGIGVFGMDAVVGSVFVGGVLACWPATGAYLRSMRGSGRDPMFADLVRRTSDRYLGGSITAWEFARGKLRMDPVYRATLSPDMLPPGGTLLDIGCGQGLTLALLVEARRAFDASTAGRPRRRSLRDSIAWSASKCGRARLRSRGKRSTAMPRSFTPTLRTLTLEPAPRCCCSTSFSFCGRTNRRRCSAASPRGSSPAVVVLIREADPAVGWRFTAVRVGNRLKAVVFGTRKTQAFHPRTQAEWRDCFARLGFRARSGRWATGRRSPTCCSASPGRPDGSGSRRPTFTSCVSARPSAIEHAACPQAHDTRPGVDAGPQ